MANEEDDGRPWWMDLPGRPVDSLAELKKFGINPRFVHSCSEPVGSDNAGCPRWNVCDMTFKGTRPHNGGVEVLKRNGRSRRVIADCFDFATMRENVSDIGGDAEWIADEGQPFESDATKKVPDPNQAGQFIHKAESDKLMIPEFICLKDRPETQHLVRLEEKRARRAVEKRDRKRDRLMGVTEDDSQEAEAPAADADVAESGAGERSRPHRSIGKGSRTPDAG